MEVSETNSHDGLNDVSLQQETACTVESKALEENGGDLAFPSTFSPETQVGSQLAALGKHFKIIILGLKNIYLAPLEQTRIFSGYLMNLTRIL